MANKQVAKKKARLRRKMRIRKKVYGTPERPRLTVFRSARHIYAQIVDDVSGRTITGVSSLTPALREQVEALRKEKGKTEVSKLVGKELAKKALEKGIERVVFDRNGYVYHGRVKAVADGAREGGLKF
ncbi:MAG TPA: 50S ribosomal protein L18 [Bacteroidetes bacterium]|nr:50S ribosomal protein L18 [Bacteroidota bacterium]